MSQYDVLICVDQTMLNEVTASLYARPTLRAKLFTGTKTATVMDVPLTVAYDVLQAPTVSLNAPTAEQWQKAIKVDGAVAQPVTNAFVVTLPALKVEQRPSGGTPSQATIALDTILTVSLVNNDISIDPLAVVVDLSHASAFDQVMYKLILIPQVLKLVDEMLSGKQLPDVSFVGVKFGHVVLAVGNGRLAAAANLDGKPVPAAPALAAVPAGKFTVLLSPEAMQQIATAGTQSLEGKTSTTSGSQSFGIGKANYSAGIKLNRGSVTVNPADLTTVAAVVGLTVSASAGIDVVDATLGAVESAATTAANAVASTATTAANAVANTATTATKEVEKAFKSY